MNRTLARLSVLGVAIVLAAAGCSDDGDNGDDAGEVTPDDVEDVVEGDDSDVDPCSLLEVSEIEAEFGEQGTVLEGEESLDQCSWEVGEDQSQPGTGSVHVFVQFIDPDLPIDPIEDMFAGQEESTPDAVAVEGIGDAAYYAPNSGSVNVRSGDLIWFVQATFIPEPEGMQEKVESLAGIVEGRL